MSFSDSTRAPLATPFREQSHVDGEAYRTALGEFVTLEEAGPAPFLVHDATWSTRSQAQALAGQLHPTVLTFGHVDGTEQRLDDGPTAGSVPQTWDEGRGGETRIKTP